MTTTTVWATAGSVPACPALPGGVRRGGILPG